MTHDTTISTRRSVLRAAAWTAPAVTLAVAAPAFAASVTLSCTPSGFKAPGEGENTKDYFLTPTCNTGEVISVTIDGTPALLQDDGVWVLRGRPESDSLRYVVIETTAGQWSGMVHFPPR